MSNQARVTREWDAMADDWDDLAAPYVRSFYRTLEARGLLLGGNNNKQHMVLDFGCGTGLLTELLQHKCTSIVALDASPNMIHLLRDKQQSNDWSNVTVVHGLLANEATAASLVAEFRNQFDLILASSVLHVIPRTDRPATLQVLAQLLKPNTGRLCHSDWPKDEQEHPDGLELEELRLLFRDAGLSLVESGPTAFRISRHETAQVLFGVAMKVQMES